MFWVLETVAYETREEDTMALVRWEPFRDLNAFDRQVNRFFGGGNGFGWPERPTTASAWSPDVDIFEDENEIVVHAELPGVESKDVDLNIENNVLTISGQRNLEYEDKKENYHRVERSYGTFSRSFSLPRLIDETKIRAEYKNGILKVHVPKHEKAKPRQIAISS